MAYLVDNNNDVIIDNPTPLGIKSTFNNVGIFSTNYSNSQQAVDNLKNLLLTRRGERLYHPNFGCDLLNLIFQPMTEYLTTQINDVIRSSISFWLPYLVIETLDVQLNSDEIIPNHTLKITLTVSLFGSIQTNTVVIFAAENGILRVE